MNTRSITDSILTIKRIYTQRHEKAVAHKQPTAFVDHLDMVIKDCDQLIGAIEMTETYIPGKKPEGPPYDTNKTTSKVERTPDPKKME